MEIKNRRSQALRDAVEREVTTPDGDPADRFSHGAMERLRAAVRDTTTIDAMASEVDRLREALDEREGDMHMRIRAGYDRTIADSWRAKVAEVERERDEAIARAERAEAALAKVNAIRNSIIGSQTVNWSEHVYPLVAALDAAGVEGLGYEEARRSVGTLLERAERAEAQLAALREASAVIPALYRDISESSAVVPLSSEQWSAFCAAVSDSKAAADEHDRRVRAEALREAADAAGKRHFSMGGLAGAEQWLRARADEIERGER